VLYYLLSYTGMQTELQPLYCKSLIHRLIAVAVNEIAHLPLARQRR